MIGTGDGGGVRIKGTLQQRQLARALRRLREEAGLTLEEAAPKLDWSTSKLGRIETAQQGVDVHGVRSMLDLSNVGGAQWTEIIDMVREARKRNEWHAYGISDQGYLRLEMDAAVVHEYQLAYVPGLLQTENYMRTLFRNSRRRPTDAEIDQDVRVIPRTPPGPSWRAPAPSGGSSSVASRPASSADRDFSVAVRQR